MTESTPCPSCGAPFLGEKCTYCGTEHHKPRRNPKVVIEPLAIIAVIGLAILFVSLPKWPERALEVSPAVVVSTSFTTEKLAGGLVSVGCH